MINKTKTSTFFALKSIALIPFLIVFFINFQTEVVAQEKPGKDSISTTPKKSDKITWFVSDVRFEYKDENKVYNSKTDYKNLKHQNESLPETLKYEDEISNKNKRIIITINKYADLEYLEYVKTFLLDKHEITIHYHDLRYDDEGLLTGIDLSVIAQDGFSGALTQITNKPLGDIYVYRDYSEEAKSPFGVGILPDSFKNSETAEFITTTQLSPGKQPEEEKTNKEIPEVVDLRNVETFIINGKTLQLKEIPDMVVLIESYESIDEKTFKVDGETLKDDDFKAFFQSNDDEFTNKKTIFFMNSEAVFSLFSKSNSKKNNRVTHLGRD